MAQTDAPRLTGAPVPQRRGYQPAAAPASRQPPPSHKPLVSVDNAVAEIAERQRTLYGDDAVTPGAPVAASSDPAATPAPPPLPDSQYMSEPPLDISNLEEQLRYITTQIESLRPSGDLEKVIKSFRRDLTDIREQITGALPRRAVESLEIEVQALAKRLDHSRESGVDLGVLAGLESGLSEVRDALRNLTPAENLVGFDDAVKALSQKVDLIIAKEDPAALQQLETAIGALRGIVSHVASNDTLTKVAEDVRLLAAKVDGVANTAASGHAVSALESRLDTLANALSASSEAGHAVPRELEKLLSGLIEKLEWVQLTHTDHAALGALEDRIAQLIKRLDTSDARLGNLEAVERGLADLLVHIDQIRGSGGAATVGATRKPADAIERDVAEIKRSERRTQDSLEAVHGAVEHVVDRLAMIESGMHEGAPRAEASTDAEPAPEPAPPRAAKLRPCAAAAPETPATPTANAEIPGRRGATPRTPIDPNLPPDHPLEPGSAGGQRATPSAAERIAASEAAAGFAKPPFRRAGRQAEFHRRRAARRAGRRRGAARAPGARRKRHDPCRAIGETVAPAQADRRRRRGAHCRRLPAHRIAHVPGPRNSKRQSGGTAGRAKQQPAPPKVLPEADSSKTEPQSGPLILPVPGAPGQSAPTAVPGTPTAPAPGASSDPTPTAPPSTMPSAPAATPPMPQRQSALPNWGDITGALPRRVPPPPQAQPPASIAAGQVPAASAPAMVVEKLPATIGGPKLRAAAIAGDAAAEFEVATRFAEGHGGLQSDGEAVRWLELAAKQGLAPAQFRLGGFYEKGIGVRKDLAAARDLYAAAAAKGNAKAMHNLAVLYAEGIDGPADYRTAAQWFRKAADRGITDSQYNLAILYARGIGVEQNYAESYKWFALAASKGDGDAAKKRDEVAAHLDAQALAAAKLAVQKWTAEPQPDNAMGVKAPPGGWDASEHAEKSKPRPIAGKPLTLESKLN